jgi:hypothetical protein
VVSFIPLAASSSGERVPYGLCRRGWRSPRAGLDAVVKREFFVFMGNEILIAQPIICSLYQLNYPGFRG